MRQERLYTLVGIFIVGALSLMIFGAIFFYNEYLRAQVETYVMFFKGSLTGLEPSSIVTYRGVKIGQVTAIEITENKAKNEVEIPVYVQFFVEKTFGLRRNPMRTLIRKGYVADISKPNFLTGVANIELVQSLPVHKNKRTRYRNYPVFPTINSVDKYTTLDDALKTAKKTMEDISKLVRSEEMRQTINAVKNMADSFERLTNTLSEDTPPVLTYFTQTLKQISGAAYSAQNLTDFLSRHPESLLRGKQ